MRKSFSMLPHASKTPLRGADMSNKCKVAIYQP